MAVGLDDTGDPNSGEDGVEGNLCDGGTLNRDERDEIENEAGV